MWDDVSLLSGIPSFRLSDNHDVAAQDKLSSLNIEDYSRQLEMTESELSRKEARHNE